MKIRNVVLLIFIWCILLKVLAVFPRNDFPIKIKVACVENPVTRVYGLSNPMRDYYSPWLRKLFGENYHVQNFGCSGATILPKGYYLYIKILEYVETLCFDVDIVYLTLNDTNPRK